MNYTVEYNGITYFVFLTESTFKVFAHDGTGTHLVSNGVAMGSMDNSFYGAFKSVYDFAKVVEGLTIREFKTNCFKGLDECL